MKKCIQIGICGLLFFLSLWVASCNKEVSEEPQNSPTRSHRRAPVDSYLTGTLGSENINVQSDAAPYTKAVDEDGHGNNGNGHGHGAGNSHAIMVSGSSWSAPGIANSNGSIEIRQEIFRIYVTPFLSHGYYDMLTPGTYELATPSDTANGAYLRITDQAGTTWTTLGDQTGSSVTITSRSPGQGNSATVTGTVNCKMYDATGNTRQFSSGTFATKMGI